MNVNYPFSVVPGQQRWRWDLNPRRGCPLTRFRGVRPRPLGDSTAGEHTRPGRSRLLVKVPPPGGHVPGMHIHPLQEERFEATSGKMKFRYGLKTIVAEAGETVVVPPGKIHNFAQYGDEPSQCRVEIHPALKMEQLFETTVALAKGRQHERQGHAQAA